MNTNKDEAKYMMTLNDAEGMYKKSHIIKDEDYDYLVLSGYGYVVVAKMIENNSLRRCEIISIEHFQKYNELVNAICDTAKSLGNPVVVINYGAVDIAVCQSVEDRYRVNRVSLGMCCFKKENKERFFNLCAYALYQAAEAAKNNRLSVLCSEYKEKIILQSSHIPKKYTIDLKVQIPVMDSEEWELKDVGLWKVVSLAFAESVFYKIA